MDALRAAHHLAALNFTKNFQVVYITGERIPDLQDFEECSTSLLLGSDLKSLLESCRKEVVGLDFGNGHTGVGIHIFGNLNLFAMEETVKVGPQP